jgi:hypothetical protein
MGRVYPADKLTQGDRMKVQKIKKSDSMVGYYKGSSVHVPAEYLIDNRYRVTYSCGSWIIWDTKEDKYVHELPSFKRAKLYIEKLSTL